MCVFGTMDLRLNGTRSMDLGAVLFVSQHFFIGGCTAVIYPNTSTPPPPPPALTNGRAYCMVQASVGWTRYHAQVYVKN
jgi:hypothetical protein